MASHSIIKVTEEQYFICCFLVMIWIHTVCSEGVTALQVTSFPVFPPPPTTLPLLLCVISISYTVKMQLLQVGSPLPSAFPSIVCYISYINLLCNCFTARVIFYGLFTLWSEHCRLLWFQNFNFFWIVFWDQLDARRCDRQVNPERK